MIVVFTATDSRSDDEDAGEVRLMYDTCFYSNGFKV